MSLKNKIYELSKFYYSSAFVLIMIKINISVYYFLFVYKDLWKSNV